MGGVNAAIEVGKHKLDVALGSDGELFSEPNQPRAITRLAKRLAQVGCERVLIEGGSYQNVLVGALRAAGEGGGGVRTSDDTEQCPSSKGALLSVLPPATRKARVR